MGEVHLATGAAGEERALKVLSPRARESRELTKRFMGEVQVLSYLEHAHVVRFFETGTLERDGLTVLWVALEYLRGRTLRDVLRANPDGLDEEAIIRWGRQIAAGVHEAHKLAVVHRDLKPENVIVVGDDLAKVIDFGIAKFRDWGDTRSRTSGAKVGTLLYMAPEQLDDALGVAIDARTDVYALGVVLYELATGRQPYLGSDGSADMASLLVRKLAEELPPVCSQAPRLSADLGAIIDRASCHDAARRFPDMGALHDALGAVWRARMDERRAKMLGAASAGRTPNPPPVVRAGEATAPVLPEGQSSRFESVRTLPEVVSPQGLRRRVRDAALLGSMLGIACGLVAFRAVVEPRLARSVVAAAPPAGAPSHRVADRGAEQGPPPNAPGSPSSSAATASRSEEIPSLASAAPAADARAGSPPASAAPSSVRSGGPLRSAPTSRPGAEVLIHPPGREE